MAQNAYTTIEKAIRFLEQHARAQPTLDEVAAHIGLSPHHFQRLFKRWAGISPKRFLQHLTVQSARDLLRQSASVLETSFAVGLSGPGRLHDLFVNIDAVTPGEFKRSGSDLNIRYGFHPTPFGDCLLAATERGICHLSFIEPDDQGRALETLRDAWPEAILIPDQGAGEKAVRQIFDKPVPPQEEALTLFLKGTNFQLKVWEALLRIPAGRAISYGTLARAVDRPGAARAVGTAVGRNPIAYLIPCHRVLRESGAVGGYRWGTTRKRAILAFEASTTTR